MQRYRATIAYDGSGYQGFQRLRKGAQHSAASIINELETALGKLSAEGPVEVIGSGRTDAGVHATGQVIAFDMAWRHGEMELQRALNAHLPSDIAILSLERASPDFHPRYGATRRVYEYRIYQSPTRMPLLERTAWHVAQPLDQSAMNAAGVLLIGSHDFASFGNPPRGEKGTTLRTVYRTDWSESASQFGTLRIPTCVFSIEANAFLYRMVRTVVGALVAVGQGRWTQDDFAEAFEAQARGKIPFLAPAHGLTLVQVRYDDDNSVSSVISARDNPGNTVRKAGKTPAGAG